MLFKYKDIPADTTVLDCITSQEEWARAVSAVSCQYAPNLQLPGLHFDHDTLRHELGTFHKRWGVYPWQKPNVELLPGMVVGASLSYNPDHPEEEWLIGSFGSRMIPHAQHCQIDGAANSRGRGSYFDSLGFRVLHPGIATHCPQLCKLLNRFKFPLVRISARTVLGYRCESGWKGNPHVDESPFEVLRINLAIENNGDFTMEYESGDVVGPVSGGHFVVNGHMRHTVKMRFDSLSTRTHLVIGVLPWLTYDPELDSWRLNEYCGKIHPFDMVREGLIFV